MFIIGILVGVTMFLPVLVIIFLQNNDTASTAVAAIVLCLFLGAPCFLLVFFGARLFRRKKPTSEVRLAGAAPATPSNSYSGYEPKSGAPDQVDEWLKHLNKRAKELNEQKKSLPSVNTKASSPQPQKAKTAICKNCGASKVVAPGQPEACDYCGTLLN
ncbi:hypothetical protein ACX1C1_13590 [Paenibacillus sp. strain BS8-2]